MHFKNFVSCYRTNLTCNRKIIECLFLYPLAIVIHHFCLLCFLIFDNLMKDSGLLLFLKFVFLIIWLLESFVFFVSPFASLPSLLNLQPELDIKIHHSFHWVKPPPLEQAVIPKAPVRPLWAPLPTPSLSSGCSFSFSPPYCATGPFSSVL